MKLLFSFLILFHFGYSQIIEHFLLPSDGDKAEQSIISAIQNAQHNIDVAMFMITNKKLTTAIKERAKKGHIQIRIIADKSYDDSHKKISKVNSLSLKKNISLYATKGLKKKKNKFGIMHAKLVIIDDDIVYIGSTNWTKSAFHKNYEILMKITDNTTVKLYKYYFSDMLLQAQKYM